MALAANDPHIEARIARLEADVNHIRSDVGDVKQDVRDLRARLDTNGERADTRSEGLRQRLDDGFDGLRLDADKRSEELRTYVDSRFDDLRLSNRISAVERSLASAKVWALLLFIAQAAAVYGTLARSMGWI